jgi:hypothetical protein
MEGANEVYMRINRGDAISRPNRYAERILGILLAEFGHLLSAAIFPENFEFPSEVF